MPIGQYRGVGKAVSIATGAAFRRLEVQELMANWRRVYYGAAYTEAMNYKDQPVFVVGGANSAGQGAMFSALRKQVTMLIGETPNGHSNIWWMQKQPSKDRKIIQHGDPRNSERR
jgi:thioredoxin reductase